ncbi:MAG: NAD(P)H-dependent oxidoreductase [Flavobacteriaceae bacterium]|nr:MAG: NAD(P)H-dependent oxidoreductase [Flavobacteriaceae bacterium]
MDIIKSLEWRYATKKFDASKKLSTQQIETLKEAFNLTATSYGLQPIRLVVVSNQAMKESLVPHSFGQHQVADASHLLVICIQEQITTKDINANFDQQLAERNVEEKDIEGFRNFLLDSFDKMTLDKHQEIGKLNAYIALGNLLTVCAIEKIDACPMEGFIPAKYDEILGLKKYQLKSVLALPVGYRDANDFMQKMAKMRKTLDQITITID